MPPNYAPNPHFEFIFIHSSAPPAIRLFPVNGGETTNASIAMTLVEPSLLELRCLASGYPLPIVSWALNGRTLLTTARVYDRLLTGQSPAMSANRNVIYIDEYGNGASSHVDANVTDWYQTKPPRGGRVEKHGAEGGGGIVSISLVFSVDAAEKKVSGNYTCSAINAVGSAKGMVHLNVLGKPFRFPFIVATALFAEIHLTISHSRSSSSTIIPQTERHRWRPVADKY